MADKKNFDEKLKSANKAADEAGKFGCAVMGFILLCFFLYFLGAFMWGLITG
jgi:hypothetical protein